MTVQVNGWFVLGLLVVLLLGYSVGFVSVKLMMPAAVAQIAGNQELVGQVNQAFENHGKTIDTRLTQIETRVGVLETQQ